MSGAALVVRAPNHLGDLVLALPALRRAAGDVAVRRPLAALIRLAAPELRVHELARGAAGLIRASRQLRGERYRRGILLTPSFSSALLFRLAGIAERRGVPSDGRRLLLSEPVWLARGTHRAAEYMALATDHAVREPPLPRIEVNGAVRQAWLKAAGGAVDVAVCPGSRASSRRWPAERFGAVVEALTGDGLRVAVLGGADEAGLTRAVSGSTASDFGARTDLQLLAAALASVRVVVTNDSGPMHLAAAVGTPTVVPWGAGDRTETGPLGSGHQVLGEPLPCAPCRRQACPRTGSGTRLPRANRECLALIPVERVLAAVHQVLASRPPA